MGRNQVTLTFAGDAEKLTKAFQKVQTEAKDTETAIKTMGDGTGRAFDGFRNRAARASDGLDRISDSADRSEQRIVGMRDGITGTKDLMEGWRTGSMELVLTGFADLASSVANFAGPVLGRLAAATGLTTLATKAQAAAQTVLNAVMNANPYVKVALVLAALAAAVVVAYQRSETFRSIVKAAFDAVAGAAERVKDAGQAVLDKLLALYNSPAANAVKSLLTGAFNGAANAVESVRDAVGAVMDKVEAASKNKAAQLLKDAFVKYFTLMLTPIRLVATAIDGVIGKIQWAIDKLSALRNMLHTKVDQKKVQERLYGGTIPGRNANGGLITSRQLSYVGEQGPELILPLNRPTRARQLMDQAGIGGQVVINVNGATVRDQSDIDRLAMAIGQRVAMAGAF